MAAIDGKWAIEVATPLGSQRFDLTVSTGGTTLTGTAVGPTGPVALRNGVAAGDTAEFLLDFVAPVPMTVAVELTVTGDRLTGTAQAGFFPASTVLGTRTG